MFSISIDSVDAPENPFTSGWRTSLSLQIKQEGNQPGPHGGDGLHADKPPLYD